MNALLLIVLAALAFAFGYRFYAKLLALAIFRLDKNYSMPAHTRRDGRRYEPAHRALVLGHHVAACSALVPAASLAALAWGWVPAFLWAVIGATVAGGLFGLGSLWLSARRPGVGPDGLVADPIGRHARLPALALFALLLALLAAAAASLAGALLAAHPGVVLPYGLLLAVAWGLGRALHGRNARAILPVSGLALLVLLVGTALFGKLGVAFTGALNLDVRGTSVLTLTATPAWTVLLFVYMYGSLRAPVDRLARPTAYLSALLAGCVLLVLFAGLLIANPQLPVPAFHRPEGGPGALPFLFVTLTSGALAGIYLLLGSTVTVPQLERETDARAVGYGSALALGALALGALLAGGAAFRDAEAWNAAYGSWQGLADLRGMFGFYLDGFARVASGLGLDEPYARHLAVLGAAGLLSATLEAALRVLKELLAELAGHRRRAAPGEPPQAQEEVAVTDRRDRRLTALALGVPALIALYATAHPFGVEGLRALGTLDLLAAAGGALALSAALQRVRQPVALVAALFAATVLVLAWAVLGQMVEWGIRGDWFRVGLWLALLFAVLRLAVAGWRVLVPTAAPSPPPRI